MGGALDNTKTGFGRGVGVRRGGRCWSTGRAGGWMKCRREHRNSLQVGVSEEEVGAGPQAAAWRSV